MRLRPSGLLLLTTSLAPAAVAAQAAAPAATASPVLSATARPAASLTLSLAEALKQARATSPTYRQTANDLGPARAAERAAKGALLPSLNTSGTAGYQGPGTQAFGGALFSPPGILTSSWALNAQWQVNGQRLTAVAQQRANERATEADIDQAGAALTAEITTQYLLALQLDAQEQVAREQVKRNDDFLALAKARYQVGQATLLDVRQAEVQRGTAEVALLRAAQSRNEASIELFRRIGTPPPVAVEAVALSDSFPMQEPRWTLDELLRAAEAANPQLVAFRAREAAARQQWRGARSEYTPTLGVFASIGGFTQQFTNTDAQQAGALSGGQAQAAACQRNNQINQALNLGPVVADCFAAAGLQPGGQALTDAVRTGIVSANEQFPFNFRRNPFQLTAQLSFPLFTGWARSQRIAVAHTAQLDAEERVRAQALQVRSDVNARWLAARTAWSIVAVQDRNRLAARDQLKLAQDRYRLGNGTALELADAQNAVQRAEGDYVNAVYDYHRQVALLELAIGRPLR